MTRITTQIEGIPVRGRITGRSAASIEVVLEEPYGRLHLTDDSNVMAAAQRHVSFESERGDDVAARLLRDLYLLARHLEDHRAELVQGWAAIRNQLDQRRPRVARSPKELEQRVAEVAEQLRTGAISQATHAQQVCTLREDFNDYLLAAEEAAVALWQERGFDVSYELAQQLITIIDAAFTFDSDDQGGGDE